jgi:multidrug efflux system outer membrane protein
MRKLVCLSLCLVMLGGCTVGPKYKRPAVNSPVNYYIDSSPQTNSIADLAWWELFKDPVLQGLIQEAL